ncbi:MAG: hypothetical protein RL115_1784, partial [Bacteroidota bacterium]
MAYIIDLQTLSERWIGFLLQCLPC